MLHRSVPGRIATRTDNLNRTDMPTPEGSSRVKRLKQTKGRNGVLTDRPAQENMPFSEVKKTTQIEKAPEQSVIKMLKNEEQVVQVIHKLINSYYCTKRPIRT